MWDLLSESVPLGVAAAITPTLFALQVLVVSGPKWKARALAVGVGSGAVFLAVFGLILAGMSQLPDAGSGATTTTEYWIEFGAGVALIPVAVWMLRPHRRADAALEKKVRGYAQHASPWVFAGLAAYMSITDFSSLVLLLPALHDVTSSAVGLVSKAVVVALLFVVVMLPIWSPPLAVRVAGDRGVHVLNRVYAFLMGHQIEVMGAVLGLVSVVLIARAAPNVVG